MEVACIQNAVEDMDMRREQGLVHCITWMNTCDNEVCTGTRSQDTFSPTLLPQDDREKEQLQAHDDVGGMRRMRRFIHRQR